MDIFTGSIFPFQVNDNFRHQGTPSGNHRIRFRRSRGYGKQAFTFFTNARNKVFRNVMCQGATPIAGSSLEVPDVTTDQDEPSVLVIIVPESPTATQVEDP